jgi:hypothetical protein
MREHEYVAGDGTWPFARGSIRVLRSRESLARLRGDVEEWFDAHQADERFGRFSNHLDVLRSVLIRMLDAVESDLATLAEANGPSGAVYERCRQNEQRMSVVRRIHEWYAAKYDQRIDERTAPTLRGVDEVIRSCWAEPFLRTGRQPPTGPLAYLDPGYDPTATPRVSVPSDLRAAGDDVIGQFIRELPIPVVALPAVSVAEPWWLVVAAHETGHHVQLDLLPDLDQVTRNALRTALSTAPGDDELALAWAGWGREVFADTWATVCVGPGAAWAVEELQHARPSRLVITPVPGDRYPPPAVRTALLGELARCAGAADPGPGAAEVGQWLETMAAGQVSEAARALVARHLAVVPRAAQTLVDLPVDGIPLREVAGWTATRFSADGPVRRWAVQLTRLQPVIPGRGDLAAARQGIAAGVLAYQDAARAGDSVLGRLRANLPALLASCGPPGVLAAGPAEKAGALADRLAELLLAVGDETDT